MMKTAIAAAALLLGLAPASFAGVMYGVTQTNLVIVDTSNAANTTVVGAHQLAANLTPSYLAYHVAADKLVGLVLQISGVNQDAYLYEYNRSSGQATLLASLGHSQTVGYYESLEYHVGAGSLVVSNAGPNDAFTRFLRLLSLDGVIGTSVDTGVDNDTNVYDSLRGIFYGSDPNGPGTLINYSGNIIVGGVVNTLGDMAYDAEADRVYGVNYVSGMLIRYATDGTAASLSAENVGVIGGDMVNGIAWVAAIPEPASATLMLLGCAALFNRRRR